MKSVWLIARRELGATLRSPLGFVVVALVLLADGLLFNVWALDDKAKLSAQVIYDFFYFLSGTTMVASIFISMRLLAEEQRDGTISLLLTSPVRDYHIVLGKFIGAWLFLAVLTLVTLYMPLLIMVNGKISWGHLFAGYLGLLLLGAASLGIGMFGSAVTRSQIVAAVVSAVILLAMLLLWLAGPKVDPPLNDVVSYMSLHNLHFRSFMSGKVHLRDVVFYLSVSAFFLTAATRILESRRWR